MIQQPHEGYDIIKGEPLNVLVFQQYQVYLRNVKILLKDNKLFISYPSDHVLMLPEIPEYVGEQIEKDKEVLIWEINPHTGQIIERYKATY